MMPKKNFIHNPRLITIILTVLTLILALIAVITALELQRRRNVNPEQGQAATIAKAECKVYAVYDKNLADSQFITIDVVTKKITPFGPLYKTSDIEGIEIAADGTLYAVAGSDNKQGKNGYLFKVDAKTAELFPIGYTKFPELVGLSFNDIDGTLWAWSEANGLLKLNPATASAELKIKSSINIEALAWIKSDLYGASNKDLYKIDVTKGTLTKIATNLPGEVEAFEARPDGNLMGGLDKSGTFNIFAYDPIQKKEVRTDSISSAEFDDIESIAWHSGCGTPEEPKPTPTPTRVSTPTPTPTKTPTPTPTVVITTTTVSTPTPTKTPTPTPSKTPTPTTTPVVTVTLTPVSTPTSTPTPTATPSPTPSPSPSPTVTVAPQATARCENLVLDPASGFVRGSTTTLKVTTKGQFGANYNYKVTVKGGTNTGNYSQEYTIAKSGITTTVTDSFGPITPLVQSDLTQPASYTVSVLNNGGANELTNTTGCATTFTIMPLIPSAKCENLTIAAGPYVAGAKPVITVTTSGKNEADYTYKVELKGDSNTGNYSYSANTTKTNAIAGATDSFTPTNGIVQTNVGVAAVYTVTVSDARGGSDNTNVTDTAVCAASFTMPAQGYTIIKQAVKTDGTTTAGVVEPNTSFKYIVTVANTTGTPVSSITVVDTFDPTYDSKFTISNISNSGSKVGNTITWTGINVSANATVQLTFDALVNANFFTGLTQCSQTVNNIVSSPSPVAQPNFSVDVTVLNKQCDEEYVVTKDVSPSSVAPSTDVVYTAQVSNTGDKSGQVLRITDDYPDSFTYVGPSTFVKPDGSSFTKDPTIDGGRLIWIFTDNNEIVNLAAGQQMTITYKMKASANDGLYPNTICVEVPNAGCDNANVTVITPGLPNTGVIKTKSYIKYIGFALILSAIPAYWIVNRRKWHFNVAGSKKSGTDDLKDKVSDIVSKLKK
jgi:hypothetical protein